MQYTRIIFGALALSVFGIGCDSDEKPRVSSQFVSTGQLTAVLQITEDGSGSAEAIAQFSRFNNEEGQEEIVFLESRDKLWLSTEESIDDVPLGGDIFENIENLANSQVVFRPGRQRRASSSFLFGYEIVQEDTDWYAASLPDSLSGEYRIALLREEALSAKESVVLMPEPFEASFATEEASISRSVDSLIIEWTNTQAEASVIITARLTCPGNFQFDYSSPVLPDTGIYTINPGDLMIDGALGDCSTIFTVRKTVVGELDLAFGDGRIDGNQVRRISIRTLD